MFSPIKTTDFRGIRLKLASTEDILDWSHGEVLKPETINYRTQRPEKDGLFCEKIFGPSKDWECYCGKYKKIRYKGIVCDKCGVEVTRSIVRRERMGHIKLSVPVSHIWFLRGVPSKIGLILDMSIQNLEKVIYFANFIITGVNQELKEQTLEQIKNEYKGKNKLIEAEFIQQAENLKNKKSAGAGLSKAEEMKISQLKELDEIFAIAEKELKDLKPLQIISESAYQDLSLKYGHVFEASIGAEAIRAILEKIDLKETISQLEKELKKATGTKKEKLIRRIKLIKSLEKNKIRPEWMILEVIPVIPPDLRPMVPLDGGRFATSDLNDLYRRVINRNNRLKQLIELKAPEVITRNEKRMLQEAVDALIDNGARRGKTVTASTGQKRMLKSLADMLKGKQGRFRQNLLGKRVDYSGRSVIVVGSRLKLHQCGLPKKMALELFKPFIISRLIRDGLVHNVRSATRYIESDRPEIWDILEDITKEAHVLLNRAPTLHRLGIQAFAPVLIEGKAIKIHPLVCTAFNADFDGDQMAVHLPLTEDAKKEAKELMLSSKNLLKPATGDAITAPTKDMVWGTHYMTYINEEEEATEYFSSPKEAIVKHNLGLLPLRKKIKVRFNDNKMTGLSETSVGRILFNQILPAELPFVNSLVDSKELKALVRAAIKQIGIEPSSKLLDDVKELGFEYITRSGLSWGMDDIPVLTDKPEIIREAEKRVDEIQEQYETGLLTQSERYTKIIEIWTEVKDKIVKIARQALDKEGSIFTMVESGARGSWGQLTQIVGMKGLVTNPAGEIIELPVRGSFKEGFDILEYFISTHGARKGLSDTALRTANAGYLTRRLIDVAQDVFIHQEDCQTSEGTEVTKQESREIGKDLAERIIGRYAAETIKDPGTGDILFKKNQLIVEERLEDLRKIDLDKVKIRSLLTCRAIKGVCQKCYGLDLAQNKPVDLGTAVGIIAAQSIGEPGTQLTMRTFHTGGVVGADITQGLPRVEEIFEVRSPKRKSIVSEVDGQASVSDVAVVSGKETNEEEALKVQSVRQKLVRISYKGLKEDVQPVPDKAQVRVKDGVRVSRGDVLLVSADDQEIKAQKGGLIKLEDKEIKVVYEADLVKEYLVPIGYNIWVKDGDLVVKGQQLTEGDVDLHQLFNLRGADETQRYIIKEIQRIYSSQGQKLNDKHIELVARQLFSRVYVKTPGDTNLLPGEIVERAELEEENARVTAEKGQPAEAEQLLLGVTKVSLSTRSFLSAASFQETSKVLINAAITGKIDWLEGLKENVIIGRLIPVGSGFREPTEE
ncbi:MAG TPA: DNA-directed RNA polymerase subunit beta' [Patescibacteria group bacterium]